MYEGYKSAGNYKFEEVIIESEKTGFAENIAALTSEINIYEHIDKPYLTGTLLFTDNLDYYNQIDISGSEKLRIRISLDPLTPEAFIEKNFIITEVVNSAKANDANEVFTLKFVEDVSALSKLQRVSKSFTGRPDEIIESISNEYLEREVFIPNQTSSPEPYPMKVVVPNMTPLDAMTWVKDRASTENGIPYFLFSTVCDDKLRYLDLESILEANPINSREYVYSEAFGQAVGDDEKYTFIDQSYIIQGFRTSRKENQIDLAMDGLVGATYNFIDTVTGKVHSDEFDIDEVFEEIEERNMITADQANRVYNKVNKVNGKPMHQYSTREITHIGTSGIFSDRSFNYYESAGINTHMMKVKSKALRNYLYKSSIDINVPGLNFLYKDVNKTIGNIISLVFKNTLDAENPNYRDAKRSGKYMISSVRHVFTGNRYTANVTCTRLATEFMGANS